MIALLTPQHHLNMLVVTNFIVFAHTLLWSRRAQLWRFIFFLPDFFQFLKVNGCTLSSGTNLPAKVTRHKFDLRTVYKYACQMVCVLLEYLGDTYIAGAYQTSDNCPSPRRLFSLPPRTQTPQMHTPWSSRSKGTIPIDHVWVICIRMFTLTLHTFLLLDSRKRVTVPNCEKNPRISCSKKPWGIWPT